MSQPFNETPNLGQWNLLNLATWIATYDPQTYAAWGGNLALYQPSSNYVPYGNVGGQVSGSLEAQQRQDAKKVAGYMSEHPQDAQNEQLKLHLYQQSPNDPNYRVYYWSLDNDWVHCKTALFNGASLENVVATLKSSGYTDKAASDLLCLNLGDYITEISLPSGVSSNAILAQVLGASLADRVLDPVCSINPGYTPAQIQAILAQDAGATFVSTPPGTITDSITVWANHLGGEHVNITCPAGFDANKWGSATSYIRTCFSTRWDIQNQEILFSLDTNFLAHYADVQALGQFLVAYCQQAGQANGIAYNFGDLISPVPITPTMKKYLSQSAYYNPVNLHPPTRAGAFINLMLAGWNPLVLSTDPNANPAKKIDPAVGPFPGQPVSQLGNNNTFDQLVLQTWAKEILNYQAAQPPGCPPLHEGEASLLIPFANLYAPQ